MTLQHLRLTIAALSAVTFAACGEADDRNEMSDTASPATAPANPQVAAPGALDTNAMKMDPATRSGMDTSSRDSTGADSIRRDTTRDTVPQG